MVDLLQFTNFGELMVRRLQDGETALDLASLDDWDEPGASAAEPDEIDLDDREFDDALPEVHEVLTEPASRPVGLSAGEGPRA